MNKNFECDCGNIITEDDWFGNTVNCICGASYFSLELAELPKTNDQFIKADNNKNRLSLVEPVFVEGVGEVLTYGANKYEAGNWKNIPYEELSRYKDALLRHLYAYLDGEYFDDESGLQHLKHVGCNVMFLLTLEEERITKDMMNDTK